MQSGGMKRQIEDFRIIDIKDILFENQVYIQDRDIENLSPLRLNHQKNKNLSPK
jgi:hypothetical protein